MALLANMAEDQWGLVTRAQAMAAGVPRVTLARIVAAGLLERVAHGVYRVVGTGGDPELLALRAAWLQLNPAVPAWQRGRPDEGIVSGRSAAAVYELGDLLADVHELTVPTRRQTRRPDLRLRVGHVAAGEWELVDGLPVTRPHRIVADLLTLHEDGSAIAAIADQAVRRGLVSRRELAAAVHPYAARYRLADGDQLVAQLLGDTAVRAG
jgi:hypothetical protein